MVMRRGGGRRRLGLRPPGDTLPAAPEEIGRGLSGLSRSPPVGPLRDTADAPHKVAQLTCVAPHWALLGIHPSNEDIHRFEKLYVRMPGIEWLLALRKLCGCPFADAIKIGLAHRLRLDR